MRRKRIKKMLKNDSRHIKNCIFVGYTKKRYANLVNSIATTYYTVVSFDIIAAKYFTADKICCIIFR